MYLISPQGKTKLASFVAKHMVEFAVAMRLLEEAEGKKMSKADMFDCAMKYWLGEEKLPSTVPAEKLTGAKREAIVCAYPRCTRYRVWRHEVGRVPARRKWCYLHYNGELAKQRKAYVAKLNKKEQADGRD